MGEWGCSLNKNTELAIGKPSSRLKKVKDTLYQMLGYRFYSMQHKQSICKETCNSPWESSVESSVYFDRSICYDLLKTVGFYTYQFYCWILQCYKIIKLHMHPKIIILKIQNKTSYFYAYCIFKENVLSWLPNF